MALGLGMVVELWIGALLALLPRESWLFGKVFSFMEYSHYPFLWFMEAFGPESMPGGVLALILIVGCMALIWGYLLLGGRFLLRSGLERLALSRGQKRLLGWGAGILCVAGLVYVAMDSFSDRPMPFTPSPKVGAVVAGNTALAIDLYKKFGETPGNVFFSPYSVSTGLGLVYAGARGQTESELGRAAHFGLAQADLHEAFGQLAGRMGRLQHRGRVTLISANALWGQQGHPFLGGFLDVARKRYRAEIESVDFKHDAAAISSRVNGWIERQTRGKIQGMLGAGQLDAYTRLLLCNTLYFKGNWRSQFKVGETQPAPFHVSTNKTVSVPMMRQKADLKMASIMEPQAEVLELPYYGGDLGMVIILPYELDGLADIENVLTAETLKSWLAKLDAASPNKTWVHLPRFTTRQSMDLVPVLRSLGIVSALGDAADFSGMDGTTNLFLSAALHQAFVEVNERGTEAAAGTLFEVKTKGMANRFIADHPFLFLIRDHGSGSVLFLGRLVEPL